MELSIDSIISEQESKEVLQEPANIQLSPVKSEGKLQFPDIDDATGVPIDRVPTSSPFRRWVNSLRPKKTHPVSQRYIEGWQFSPRGSCDDKYLSPHYGSQEQWEKLSGNSSHLGTMKTTTVSLTSQSVVRSRRNTQSTTNRSMKSDLRASVDSLRPVLSTSIDEEAQSRAIRRRQVLQEIVTTESDYIFGLKALTNLLLYIAARPEIYHNVQRIRETHEAFLRRVQSLTPASNISRAEVERMMLHGVQKRSLAVDLSIKALQPRTLRTRSLRSFTNRRLKELAAEAKEALVVAREIGILAKSFVYYKEFCENYELLVEDTALLRKSVRNWPTFESGIEALTKSAASMETRALYENKALCLNDILIKPAQRLCKYPLLLQELLRWTPIQDDPSVHDEIRQILHSVRHVLGDINEATVSTLSKVLVQKTFVLQEMLDSKPTVLVDLYKKLGPLALCGVLHVTYQASQQVTGAYLVCVLFKHHFFMAKMNDEYRKLRPLACLYISDVRIDSLANGKGLEYFCVFSWKLLFQRNGEKFELILSASSATEEKQWKTGILKSVAASVDVPNAVSSEMRGSSFLAFDLVPVPDISDFAPQLSRRPSLQTLGMPRVRSKLQLQPIIIKKTHCPHKHSQTQQVDGELERPKVPPPCPALILTARRQDRIRLERAILPIYTRDSLPYPGMFLATGDILFGPSSIMRHLSLRSKKYRRSSSINLPLQNLSEPQDIDKTDEKIQYNKKRKRRDASEISHFLDQEKGWSLRGDSSVEFIGRSKTLRAKTNPRRSSFNPSPQPTPKRDKSSEHSEITRPPRKGIWSLFYSVSLRKSKKNVRPSVGGK
ncbi:hypothetical protein BJY01DRAFT_247592 [Aspergillus pseudoustus]|uniref:DH domain-containing protein n=1 Tax=Aspergillus pseudoustus TaxID=1810923 RepID=A0ABR4K001_9EURO